LHLDLKYRHIVLSDKRSVSVFQVKINGAVVAGLPFFCELRPRLWDECTAVSVRFLQYL